MSLLITVQINGMIVLDPRSGDDMTLLSLLSTKEVLTRQSTYHPTEGYVGSHYEVSTLELGTAYEEPQALPRGAAEEQWRAYRARQEAQQADEKNAA